MTIKTPRFALVIGARKGIGAALCQTLAGQGFHVLACVRHHTDESRALEQTIRQKGQQLTILAQNLEQDTDVSSLLLQAEAITAGQPIEVLIPVMGDFLRKPALDTSAQEYQQLYFNNCVAPILFTQAIARQTLVSDQGRVIYFGFAGAHYLRAEPETLAYSMAKAALVQATKTFAKILAPRGITVNMIAPGVVETSIEQPVSQIPTGRMARVEEICSIANYLIQPAAGYITGQTIEVAGGWRL